MEVNAVVDTDDGVALVFAVTTSEGELPPSKLTGVGPGMVKYTEGP